MKSMNPTRLIRGTACLAALLTLTLFPKAASAQDVPSQRQIRAFIPPDQLVSFLPSTPFDRFLEFVDPIFRRVTGKQAVDPESRDFAIGVSIAGMHFLDAFELVLQYNGLSYRETDRFFVVEEAPDESAVIMGADAAAGRGGAAGGGMLEPPADINTREIQINAILFEMNMTKFKDSGLKWGVFLGGESQQGGGDTAQGGGQGGDGQSSTEFFLDTSEIFDSFDDFLRAPQQIAFSDLADFLRLLEQDGIGETIANPQVTVQSGEQGRIQIGSDVPVQVRDFAGNTVTQFFSTGIIIDVTPTLLAQRLPDSLGGDNVEFVHLDVQIEKSGSRPSTAGIVIDRNTANTQVLLLDSEQTVVGGLYSTEESTSRSGIPVLKDLPGWFFGFRYIFGNTQRTVTQKELVIVLQAKVMDSLADRVGRPIQLEVLNKHRDQLEEIMRRFNGSIEETMPKPEKYRGME